MSNDIASTDPASSVSSAFELRDEISKKLAQANGICNAVSSFGHGFDRSISSSLWAVTDLIEDVKKAVDALYEQASRSAEKGAWMSRRTS